jgi:hypothetical protein
MYAYLKSRDVGDRPVGSAGVVGATANNAEEAVLAPVGAPRVAADPEINTVLSAPAVELDGVVGGAGVASVVHVDAAGVGLNAVSVDVGGHRAAREDLGHDGIIALDGAVLGHGDLGVVVDSIALASSGVAVHAGVDGGALHVLCLVLLASNIGNAVLVHVHVGSVGVTTVASTGITTVDEGLDGGNHIALSACMFLE